MAQYTLIASRDVFECREAEHTCRLAAALRREGNEVTLFLVQNAVLGARASAEAAVLHELSGSGVQVLADAFSLRERGIPAARLSAGIQPADLDVVIDHMAAGRKVLWI